MNTHHTNTNLDAYVAMQARAYGRHPGIVISVTLREVYGRPLLYPANEAAKGLAEIAGTITLDPRILRIARRALGADVQTHQADAERVSAMLR